MMLCQKEENGKEQSIKYYATVDGDATFGNYELKHKETNEVLPGLVVRKLLLIKNGNEIRTITHV